MALLVIYIVAAVYGISSVQSFALPMMVGTIAFVSSEENQQVYEMHE